MKRDVDSRPEIGNAVEGRRVRLDRLAPGSIFRMADYTLNTVIDAGNLIRDIVEVKVHEEGRILISHIVTGEVSAVKGHEMVEPQFLELVPARGSPE